MPPSQLKRLKKSLNDQGLTGPQKSKKQKKAAAAGGKTPADRAARAANLQNIRDSFNPFELKSISSRPEKFQSTSISDKRKSDGKGGYKAVLHRPGVSKSRGEDMRRETLLPEMRRRNKVGGLVDRRIGEGDVDMTPEERAVQRFAREKERKAKGRGMFDLEGSDGEGAGGGGLLTHGGRRLEDLAADDFGDESVAGSGSDDDGEDLFTRKRRRDSEEEEGGVEVQEGDDDEAGEEEPQRKRSKKEVMMEVIAKSKMHKYERQKVKEDDDDLRDELDKGFGEILGLLQGVKKPPPPPKQPAEPAAVDANGPVVNADRQKLLDGMDRAQADKDYDVRMKQLAMDTRAKPSDRAKTVEEKAAAEAERLQKLEAKRLLRMRGVDVSDDEKEDRNGKDGKAAGPDDEQVPDDEDDYGDEAADFGFASSLPAPAKPNEQLVLDDEDEFALDEDLVASGSDAGLSDVESGAGSEDDDSDAENGAAPAEDEEDEFITGILGPDLESTAKGPERTGANAVAPGTRLAFTYPCPRTHAELLDVVGPLPVEQLTTVVQRIRALYHSSLSEANKESMAEFSKVLVEHLSYMGNEKQPLAVTEQIIRHLHSLSRTYPTEIGEAFRQQLNAFHERGQPISGDFVILTAIMSIYPTSDHWHQVVTPAITVMAKWLGLHAPSTTKPADQKTLTHGAFLVGMCLAYQRLSKRYIPEALRFTLRALQSKGIEQTSAAPHLINLTTMAEYWSSLSAFTELFTPALSILKSLPSRSGKPAHKLITTLLTTSRTKRLPLQLHNHKPQPIRTSIPKFEEGFNPDKHYDPDKERTESKKLAAEYKREKKGAVRELRKDANFMAREKLKEKRATDEAYEKKQRRLLAEIQGEAAHDQKDWERTKARNDRAREQAKKAKGGR